MDYTLLKTELEKPAYSGKTFDEVLAILNRPGTATQRNADGKIPRWIFAKWLAAVGLRLVIKRICDDTAGSYPDAIANAALAVQDFLTLPDIENISLDDPTTRAMIDGFVASGVMTPAQKVELLALADQAVSPAAVLFGSTVSADDLTHVFPLI